MENNHIDTFLFFPKIFFFFIRHPNYTLTLIEIFIFKINLTSSMIYKILIEKRERWANRCNCLWLPLGKCEDLSRDESFTLPTLFRNLRKRSSQISVLRTLYLRFISLTNSFPFLSSYNVLHVVIKVNQ
jgi:hypothetical protein